MRALARCAASVALLCAAVPLGAQRIVGTATTFGGGPGGGLILIGKDSSGAEIARAVTAEDGRFALVLPRPGFVRAEILRVGFAPTVILERAVTAGESVALNPVTTNSLIELPPRGATAPSSCGGDADGRRYVSVLLDEVRKALLSAQLGLSRPGVSARWAVTDHRLHGNGRDTSRFSIARRSGPLLSAFGSPVLGDLQRNGYVSVVGNDRTFRSLDIPALLSPWFSDSYCFTARDAAASLFVLRFEPKTRRRDYVDVTGEIHISRATMELLFIDYLYVGLSADEAQRQAGGRIEFGRAFGGGWLVTSWWIRFPQIGLIELETFRAQNQARVLQPEVLGHEILGGYTTAVLEGTRRSYAREAPGPDAGAMRSVCQERVLATPTGAARGRLTVGERPVSGSRIRATWRTAVNLGAEVPLWRDDIRETTSSGRGDWVLCDLPVGIPVELSWEIMGRRSSSNIRAVRDEVITVDGSGNVVR